MPRSMSTHTVDAHSCCIWGKLQELGILQKLRSRTLTVFEMFGQKLDRKKRLLKCRSWTEREQAGLRIAGSCCLWVWWWIDVQVCMCLCVCTYAQCTCKHVGACLCIVCDYICACTRVCVCICVCEVSLYVCACVLVCMCMYVCGVHLFEC